MDIVILVIGILTSRSFSGQIPYIVEMCKALQAEGCRVTVMTSRAGEKLFKSLGLDINFWLIDDGEEMDRPGLLRIAFTMIKRMFRAGALLKKAGFQRPTIVYSNCNLLWEVFPLRYVRDEAAVRVGTFIMSYPHPFKGYRGAFTTRLKIPTPRETLAYIQYRLALPYLKRYSDYILAYPQMFNFLKTQGVPEAKLIKLEVGVRWDILNTAVPLERRYDACWIGRYNPQKGCDDLIDIWGMITRTLPGARLAIMGNVAEELGSLSRRKNLQNSIDFLGAVDETTKYRVMKASRVFLFPSYYEAWPQTAQEAMACGLPVVAYDLPVYRHVFPGGMVRVLIGDKRALAREAVDLLQDAELRTRLSGEAFGIASQYHWENTALRMLAVVKGDRTKSSVPE
jgi:glycosyltransferase involved in cell wall biosynthesis